jgi:hypothetical protein
VIPDVECSKDIKEALITIFKEIKRTMFKELKENMMTITHLIEVVSTKKYKL